MICLSVAAPVAVAGAAFVRMEAHRRSLTKSRRRWVWAKDALPEASSSIRLEHLEFVGHTDVGAEELPVLHRVERRALHWVLLQARHLDGQL